MGDKVWKQVERRIARQLGGYRTGALSDDLADVRTPWLCIECKHRQRLPAWLKGALGQAQRYAGPDQLPIVVLHEHGRHDSMVVLSLRDFTQWFGTPGTSDTGGSRE